jgi:hypothetical protein
VGLENIQRRRKQAGPPEALGGYLVIEEARLLIVGAVERLQGIA